MPNTTLAPITFLPRVAPMQVFLLRRVWVSYDEVAMVIVRARSVLDARELAAKIERGDENKAEWVLDTYSTVQLLGYAPDQLGMDEPAGVIDYDFNAG